jgi:hypothetical protein
MENAPASTPWTLTINNSIIQGNHAGDAGGGLETDGKGKVFINNSQLLNNTCVNQGAAVWLDAIADGVASVTVNEPGTGYTTAPTVTFSAPQNAGGATATGAATITGGVVTAVTITNPGSGYTAAPTVTFSGGGATTQATGTPNLGFDNGATLTMTGDTVSGNTAINGPTGAIGNAGNGAVVITNCTVSNNFSGTTGGGFGDQNGLGTLTVSNSVFLDNSALGNGGGIQEGGPSTTITNSLIQGNSTNAAGGGIFANGATLTVSNSTIAGNTSASTSAAPPFLGGGGIELQTTGTGASASTITNTTIAGNTVLNNAGNNDGGGIDASANFTGSLALLDDSVTGNYADNGGGVFWAGTGGSAVTVQNTIIATNTANVAGPDADNAAGAFTDDGGNLIGVSGAGGGNTGFTAASTQTGTAAMPLNPQLGPLQNNGGPMIGANGGSALLTEALLVGSPALDKGVAGGPTTDERGFTRPDVVTGKPDVGAFEFQNATLAVMVAPGASPVVGGVAQFTVTVTNAGAGGLPADGSTLTVSLPAGLAPLPSSPLTFTVGALAPGQSASFVVSAAATTPGTQTVAATLTSPDANPSTVSASASITTTTAVVTPPPTVTLTPQERFVEVLYLDELGRTGSKAELDSWLPVLNGPGGQRAVASSILHSAEARDHLVKGWYVTFLGRQANGTEELGFVNALLAGQTEEVVLGGILGSPEFFGHAQTLGFSGSTGAQYVQALYKLLLNRTPGTAEVNGQVAALGAAGQQGLALSFLRSQEYRADVIGGYFTTLLHRAADPAAVNSAALSNVDLADVRLAFEASPEFFTNG